MIIQEAKPKYKLLDKRRISPGSPKKSGEILYGFASRFVFLKYGQVNFGPGMTSTRLFPSLCMSTTGKTFSLSFERK